jgi:hypothetical protein
MSFVIFIPFILMALAFLVGSIGFFSVLFLIASWAANRASDEEDSAEESPERSRSPDKLTLAIVIAILTVCIVSWLLWQVRHFGAGGL